MEPKWVQELRDAVECGEISQEEADKIYFREMAIEEAEDRANDYD